MSASLGIEHRLDLARAELDLERAQRQAEPFGGRADDRERLVGHVGPALGEQVVAGMDHRHLRRLARPRGARGIERGIVVSGAARR